MRILRTEDYQSMSEQAAALIAAQVITKPDSVLGLATGATAVGAYWKLCEWQRSGRLSLSQARTVNTDEYLNLPASHEQSHKRFMENYLLDKANIPQENQAALDGMARNIQEECRRYDRLLTDLGGMDIVLLGLGRNGHIAFNEPGSAFLLPTHPVDLSESTIQANTRLFGSRDMVPRRAITVGIAGLMAARRVVVAVSGAEKADTVARAFAGPVSPEVPASILQLHPDMVLVADKAALSCM